MEIKNKLIKQRGLCDILSYILMYVAAILIFAICSAISMNPPIPLLVYAAISCIISWSSCKNIVGDAAGSGSILGLVFGTVLAIFGGLVIAPSVLAKKIKPNIWFHFSTSMLSKCSRDELNAVREELKPYAEHMHNLFLKNSDEYKEILTHKVKDAMPCGCRYWNEIEEMNEAVEGFLNK